MGIYNNKILEYIYSHPTEQRWKQRYKGTDIERKVHRAVNGTYFPPRSTTLIERITFLFRALLSPIQIGSAIPSSKALAKEMVRPIEKFPLVGDTKKRKIIEVGPGSGVFTDQIIKKMGKKDHLTLVEYDEGFAKDLEKKYSALIKRGKIKLIHGDILNQKFDDPFDHIVSGLPLNSLGATFTKKVFEKFQEFSKKDGTTRLSYFEYQTLVPPQIVFPDIYEIKERFFRENGGREQKVNWNFTPAIVKHHQILKC